MKLVDLDPSWVGSGGEGVTQKDPASGEQVPVPRREGVGICFSCPCGCDSPCFVPLRNPLDGGPAHGDERHTWERTGETFETLTLTPSILRHGCGWHGWVTNGEIKTA